MNSQRLLATAIFLTILGLTGAGQAFAQLPVDDCAALGGSVSAGECQISSPVTASGPYAIAETLHLFNGAVITVATPGLTLNITGGLIMEAGSMIDGGNRTCFGPDRIAWPVTVNASGDINMKGPSAGLPQSVIRSNGCSGGAIVMTAAGKANIDGLVQSVGTRTGTGSTQGPGGGPITIIAGCDLTVSDTGIVSSRGADPGADLVHLEGCAVGIYGLVESTGPGHAVPNSPPNHCNNTNRPDKPANSTACVEIWGDSIIIDGFNGSGEVNADIEFSGGTGGRGWIDLYARNDISIAGMADPGLGGTGQYGGGCSAHVNDLGNGHTGCYALDHYAVHANAGVTNDDGGIITVVSTGGNVFTSDQAIQADDTNGGGQGGDVTVKADGDVSFGTASIQAKGANSGGGAQAGGVISVRSFTGQISGSAGGELNADGGGGQAPPDPGIVVLQACTGVSYGGTVIPAPASTLTPSCTGAPVPPAYVSLPECACGPPPNLQVTKTATPTFKRTFPWTINKSVTPGALNMFRGDSGSSTYTVAVTKGTAVDSDWKVTGSISVKNNGAAAALITSVSDVLTGSITATVNCGVSFPYTLDTGATLSCTYSANLPDATTRTNTAKVTSGGQEFTGTATADFTGITPTTVNGTIHVNDTNGGSWTFSDSGSVQYSKTFACDADKGSKSNTATIFETGQSSSATVQVNCYALNVTKTASTSLKRTYTWTIDKSVDQSALTLSTGQEYLVTYSIKASAIFTDSDWAVSGNISVVNNAPIDATLTGVSDVVSVGLTASVTCGVTFPYTLAKSGGTLSCTYSRSLPDATSRTNTATATLQNTPSGTTNFTGTANVNFSSATKTEIDECITVTDTYSGGPQSVQICYAQLPKTLTYIRYIGPYAVCGSYKVENTASFVTNDTGSTGSDKQTVNIYVPCEGTGGCTLTPGYWKTHSKYGPAPYDDTWALVGEDTIFFLSGQTWYQVLWTNPAPGGNVYYILGRAYIAAFLNQLNGAAVPANVQTAMDSALAFFKQYTPAQAAKLNKKTRDIYINLYTILDNYNNGLIGPGHCSEEPLSTFIK